jgi:hypothetical protein
MQNIRDLNKDLSNGVLPDSLFFGKKEVQPLDWEKVQYNTFFRNPDYFKNKFHKGLDQILPPEFFDKMAERAMTPAEEMDFRSAKPVEIYEKDNISEEKNI